MSIPIPKKMIPPGDPKGMDGDPEDLENGSAQERKHHQYQKGRYHGAAERAASALRGISLGQCQVHRRRTERIDDRQKRGETKQRESAEIGGHSCSNGEQACGWDRAGQEQLTP